MAVMSMKVRVNSRTLHREVNTPMGTSVKLWRVLETRKKLAVAGAMKKVGVRSGKLRSSIRSYHFGNRNGQWLGLYSNVDYARWHHEGTRPHIIRAKPGRVLVFTAKNVQPRASKYNRKMYMFRTVHTPIVYHPGTKANWFLRSQLVHFRL